MYLHNEVAEENLNIAVNNEVGELVYDAADEAIQEYLKEFAKQMQESLGVLIRIAPTIRPTIEQPSPSFLYQDILGFAPIIPIVGGYLHLRFLY